MKSVIRNQIPVDRERTGRGIWCPAEQRVHVNKLASGYRGSHQVVHRNGRGVYRVAKVFSLRLSQRCVAHRRDVPKIFATQDIDLCFGRRLEERKCRPKRSAAQGFHTEAKTTTVA
jgi:hypothetical protein